MCVMIKPLGSRTSPTPLFFLDLPHPRHISIAMLDQKEVTFHPLRMTGNGELATRHASASFNVALGSPIACHEVEFLQFGRRCSWSHLCLQRSASQNGE